MNKRKTGRTLSRTSDQRLALGRTMVTSLILHKRIETTLAKAKEFGPFAERMVTRAKKTTAAAKDQAVMRLLRKDLSEKAVKELLVVADGFANRNGGYTRVIKTGSRKSDSAPMAILEWVSDNKQQEKGKPADPKKGEAKEEKKVEPKKPKEVSDKQDKKKE